jgi:hypothetical protein
LSLAGFFLGERDHVLDVAGRKRRVRDQDHRHGGDQADGREILARVEAGIGEQRRIDGDRTGMREHQRIAVRCGAGDRARAHESAAAAAIVDHHLFAEGGRELVGDDARHRVDAAAGWVGNHQGDWPRRVVLGPHRLSAADHRCGHESKRSASRHSVHAKHPSKSAGWRRRNNPNPAGRRSRRRPFSTLDFRDV